MRLGVEFFRSTIGKPLNHAAMVAKHSSADIAVSSLNLRGGSRFISQISSERYLKSIHFVDAWGNSDIETLGRIVLMQSGIDSPSHPSGPRPRKPPASVVGQLILFFPQRRILRLAAGQCVMRDKN